MRKTKIVCTLGPATDDENVLRQMILAGMNTARFNFSHGDYESHQKRIDMFKKVRDELGLPVAMLLDTKGPEVRIKTFENGKVILNEGQAFTLTTKEVIGTESRVSVTYKKLPFDLSVGNKILLDDGNIEMVVEKIEDSDIICRVLTGGPLSDRKSMNLPGIDLYMPYMDDVDKEDLLFGIKNDFDYIAASFARRADDIVGMRKFLDANGGEEIEIIAKIENREGVNNIDDILAVSSGIMVARGDMGVEIDFEELPSIQKMLIKKCYSAGKRVITATQMLESMISNPRPTRAETSDVANAVYDGTSAVMLSGETAVGKYPVEAVKAMSRIARSAENDIDYKKRFQQSSLSAPAIQDAISHASCTTAHDLNARVIIVVTKSGYTARNVSKFRPNMPIVATTPNEKTYRKLALSWGVYPVKSELQGNSDALFTHAIKCVHEANYITKNDVAVIAAGIPLGESTNTLRVITVK
ncbi:MAG: pyruvate kinase [Clostridia bacterium]|nr:pyruvate kinase [Clostridia bacterium]